MFGLDAFHLARIQFAFTVSFHIIFPAITISLAIWARRKAWSADSSGVRAPYMK